MACKDKGAVDPDVPAALVASSFDGSDEEWRVVGDAQVRNGGVPYHFPNGGNPDGHVSAADDSAGGTWYWRAPAKFLGNQSAAYGRVLRFDLKTASPGPQLSSDDVVLVGAGPDALIFQAGDNPGTEWRTYVVPLQESAGWVWRATGQPPTAAEFQSVLASLASLDLRGEFIDGYDVGYLDNVLWGVVP